MQTFTYTQGDTAPGLIIVLYDRASATNDIGSGIGLSVTCNNTDSASTTTPSVTGHLDLSNNKTSVLCKMRLVDASSNIFSVYAQKIGTGADGGVYMEWPFFGTDVDSDNYEIEVTACWGIREQTAIDYIPIYIREQFALGGTIADDENVLWRGGKLYIRNTDTREVNGISLSGSTTPTINVDDGVAPSSISTTVSSVIVRIVDGVLYMYDADDLTWRQVNLKGSPAYLEVGDATPTLNAGGTEDICVATKRGRLLMKNLTTSLWQEITVIGQDGSQTINIADGEA